MSLGRVTEPHLRANVTTHQNGIIASESMPNGSWVRPTDPAVLAGFDLPEGEVLIAVPDSLLADHVRAVRA
jgi:hypothetical protein